MSHEFMLIASILFLSGVIFVPIASKLGLGSVLGYLIAGIAIGPLLNSVGTNVIELQHFAEFGVVMMLFLVGLEMSPKSLWEMRTRIFALGGLQVLVTIFLVMMIAMLFDQPWTVSLAIGMVLALSSTAIVNQTLSEKKLLKSDGGHASFSVLLFQDIAVIPMLVIIPVLALPELTELTHVSTNHNSDHGQSLSLVKHFHGWQIALASLATISLVIAAGHFLTDPIFHFVSRAKLRELFVSTALLFVLGISLLMALVGLSPALGTFLAGVVMARSEYRHELESDISPFKGLFLGVFFITVGAGIDFALLAEDLILVMSLTFGLIILKIAVLFGLACVFQVRNGHKWLFSLGLAQAGEFGFVLLSFTVANAVIPNNLADLLLLVVALSMLFTPGLFILYDKLIAPHYSTKNNREADKIDAPSSIIIAGHGRFGGIINRMLSAAGFDTTVVDHSSEHLALLRHFKLAVHFGDATRPDLLNAAGIKDAKILVIAIDDKKAITNLARYVIKHHPEVHIVTRAIDRTHVYELWSIGCRDIIRETYDSSLRAGKTALEALGFDQQKAADMMHSFEDIDRRWMLELSTLYDADIPITENKAFMKKYEETLDDWKKELKDKMQPSK